MSKDDEVPKKAIHVLLKNNATEDEETSVLHHDMARLISPFSPLFFFLSDFDGSGPFY